MTQDHSTVPLGSRALLDGFFAMNGMSAKGDAIAAVLVSLRSDGEEHVRQRLTDELHMLPCKVETLLDFVSDKVSLSDTLFALEQYRGIVPEYDTALDDLQAQIQRLSESGEMPRIDLTHF